MLTIQEKAAAAVNCRRAVLDSGLTVLCRTMPDYSTVHAMFATAFGSTTRDFVWNGRPVHLPAGTAHFLEHKMFESEQGDAFEQFARTGASANAFTSWDYTCYLFSATDRIDENLDILLDMVNHPWFTRETIAKEQGIIGQEIKMYDDSPDWRLTTEALRCLYATDPVREDIAGTVESIATLTPELLYTCTDAFYRPGNMVLTVAGNITLEQAVEACRRAGLDRPQKSCSITMPLQVETGPIPRRQTQLAMPVNRPCFALAYREQPIARGDVRRATLCDIVTELVCGGLTDLYRKLYDEGLVDPEFSGDCLATRTACAVLFTGESLQPRLVADLLRQEIARLRREGVDPRLFTLVKNEMYGELLAVLEGVENAATQLTGAWLKGCTLEDQITTLAALTPADADEALQTMLLPENEAYVQIDPVPGAPEAGE